VPDEVPVAPKPATTDEDSDVLAVIGCMRDDERQALKQILESPEEDAAAIFGALQRRATSLFGYHITGTRHGYAEIVRDTGQRIHVSTQGDTYQIESRVFQFIMDSIWNKMTPQERLAFFEGLSESANVHGKQLLKRTGIAGSALVLANMSGFGVYTLASTVIGAITSGIGVALPFPGYMAVSSAISLAIGPVAWVALGVYLVHKLTGPDHTRVLASVLLIHGARVRIAEEAATVVLPFWRRYSMMIAAVFATVVLLSTLWIWKTRSDLAHSVTIPRPHDGMVSRKPTPQTPTLSATTKANTPGIPERVFQGMSLSKLQNGIDGALQLLEDARITPELRTRCWQTGSDVIESEKFPARNAILRTVDRDGTVVDERQLERPLAKVAKDQLYGTAKSTYLITVDYTFSMGTYSGPITFFVEVSSGRLRWLDAVEPATGKRDQISLMMSPKSVWKFTDSSEGDGKDILKASCNPDQNGEFDSFTTSYIRFHFDGKNWIRLERKEKGFAEFDEVFPGKALFP
jgi:uncharacterized protein YaaW (UPF0174 family)